MSKYQEALDELEKMKQNHIQLTKEKYSHEPLKSDMVARREAHYKKVEIAVQELVDGFSKIEAEIERIKTSRVPSTDYSDGYLEGLKDALSLLGKKEGK